MHLSTKFAFPVRFTNEAEWEAMSETQQLAQVANYARLLGDQGIDIHSGRL